MEPIAVTVRGEGRWVLIHRCSDCGRLRLNKTAGDDNALALMQLAALPLSMPFIPFGHDPGPVRRTQPGSQAAPYATDRTDRTAGSG